MDFLSIIFLYFDFILFCFYQELNARGLPIARYYKYGRARLEDL